MAYDINKALERLEENLKNVDSARKQVENTVASSADLQNIVNGYVASLDSLVQDIEQLINDLANYKSLKTDELESSIHKIDAACEKTVEAFKKMLAAAEDDFKMKLNGQIEKIVSENNKLSGEVERLHENQEPLERAITTSTEVSKKTSALSENVDNYHSDDVKFQNELKTSVATLTSSVNSEFQKLDAEIKAQEKQMSTVIQKINNIKSAQEELKDKITTAQAELESKICINRWVMIAGIILLIVLHFIHF